MHNFKVGDKVQLLDVERKYNSHIRIPVGSTGVVTEVSEDCPKAVNVRMNGGHGAIDVKALRKTNEI